MVLEDAFFRRSSTRGERKLFREEVEILKRKLEAIQMFLRNQNGDCVIGCGMGPNAMMNRH